VANAVESLKVKAGDDRIHYLKAGGGRPVLFLHGGACDSQDWVDAMTALSGECTSYAPDLVGYGQSDNNRDGYRLSDFVECVLNFMDVLDLRDSVLVGHSLGGRVCLEIALRCPQMLQKIVVVNTAGFSRLARLGDFVATVAWLVRAIGRQPHPYPRMVKEGTRHGDWLCLDRLPNLNVPALIVWSRGDLYYPLAGAIKAADLMPKARLEVLPCYGHAPHRKQRDSFIRLLRGFVNQDED
jgi:2-hydroxymuconate-semialdehyde hydrolase